jgi:hypothetical protein
VFSLAVDYFLLVLVASSGVIQIVSARSGLRGLLFLPHEPSSYVLGAALLVGAFVWFVLIGDTGIAGDTGGVEGAEQFGLFLAGAAASVVATGVVASITQAKRPGGRPAGQGLDELRNATFAHLVLARLRRRSYDGRL